MSASARVLGLAIAIPTLLASALPASAQVAPAAQNAQLDEVVVTARRTSENLQVVPLSITALSSSTLERAQVRQLGDIALLTPGLSVGNSITERGQAPQIRGLSSSGDSGAVAVMLDGIYLANTGVMSLSLMDFDRVEVVKGPQSALYGHNAFAGAINYVPTAPPSTRQGKIQLRAGNYGNVAVLGAIGGPIIEDVLTVRLAGTIDRSDGSYRDAVNGARMGGWEKKAINLQARLKPNERMTFDLGAYYGKDFFGRVPQVELAANCFPNAGGVLTAWCGKLPERDLFSPVAPSKEPAENASNDREVKHIRARGTFDMEFATAVLSAGYFDTMSRSFSELHGVRNGVPYSLVGTPAGTVNLSTFFGGETANKDFETELRINSNSEGPLRWAMGAYYYETKIHNLVDIGVDRDPIPAGRQIVCPAGLACLWLTPGGQRTTSPGLTYAKNDQASVFGSVSYEVTSQLKVNAEVRYTEETKFSNVLNVATSTNPATANPDGDGLKAKFKFWNPRFTANYAMSEDSQVYVSAAKGTNAGGFNQRATLATELTYEPETNWTYEIGSKNTLFDRRLRLNVAAFWVEWKDLQSAVPSANPQDVGAVIRNFGSVTAKGGELEIAARLFSGVSVNFGAAYTDPKFNSDSYDFAAASIGICRVVPACAPRVVTNAPSPRGPVTAVSLDGLTRTGVNKVQLTAGVDINQPLSGDWTWFASASYKYASKEFSDTENIRWNSISNRVNSTIGVENGSVRVTAWAQNLLNEVNLGNGGGITRYNNFVQVPKLFFPDKRRVGVTLDYRF